MREILFRGKRIDNGEWIYGWYIKADIHWHKYGVHKDWIVCRAIQNGGICNVLGRYAVNPETVGQYTGLCDKNGNKIFEGDIVKFDFYFDNPQLVKWNNEWCAFEPIFDARPIHAYPILCDTNRVEVIDNIHDNKNLLEVEL